MNSGASSFYEDGKSWPKEFRLPLDDEEFAFPLSPAQERMWLADRARPGNSAYNGSFRWELTGPVQPRLLERAFNEIIRRHEILRATFQQMDGSPVQVIAPSLHLTLAVNDLRPLPAGERESEMDRLCLEEAQRGFDLETAPLVRAGLLQMDDERFILMFTIHHIISDGWSIGLIMEELQAIYAALAEDRAYLLPLLAIQYPDYVVWQREMAEQPAATRQLEYWRNKLAGYERLEVPADFKRPVARTTNSAIVSEMLPRELTDAIKQFSDRQEGTFFITSLAACMAILARYTGKKDIAVGSPLAGRNRSELENLVGLFINHVILRASAEGDPLFPEFAARVREAVWEAFANQDVPFENVVKSLERDGGPRPDSFFVLNFICQREYARASTFVFDFAGIRMRTMPSKSQGALYDLNVFMVEREAGWRLSLEYNVDLYSETTAQGILRDFRGLLEAIAANPNRRLSELPLPAADARRGIAQSAPSEVREPESIAERLDDPSAKQEVCAMPASAAQKRFWLLANLFPGNPAFQLPACVRLLGPLSESILEKSFQRLIERHEILRTTFEEIDGELTQVISPQRAFSLDVVSLQDVPEDQREARLQELVREEAATPCDLVRGSGIRVRLFRIAAQEHVLVVTAHHIVADGWSQGVLQKELWSVYEALSENREPALLPLPIQYGDFAAWQKDWLASDAARQCLDFWIKRLADPLPILELATDRTSTGRLSSHGAIETLLLPAELSSSLKAMTQAESATMFALLLTCFVALLARAAGEDDILVGSPVANRREETEALIGPFAGPIALRFDLSGDPTLREALHRVRDVALEALAHSDLPFESVLERVTPRSVRGRNPLFQFYFFHQTAFLQPRQLRDLTVMPLPTLSVGTPFEMQCAAIERQEGLRLQLEYNPDLYDPATIRQRLQDLQRILQTLVSNPELRLSQLPIASQRARSSETAAERTSEHVAPRDTVERELARIWADVLGRDNIGIREDFFDLGGHSLLAARLLKKIQEQLGRELALASLLDASTIERQAQLIRSGSAPLSRDSNDAPSSQIAFFYLGAYPTFRRLTQRVAQACEFHSLGMQESTCRGLGPSPALEPIATRFVSAIRERRAHGPYMLGGWCSHGVLALEVAQQLRAQGEEVALVVMIEGANPAARMAYPKWKRFISSVQLKFSLFRFECVYLSHIKRSEAVAYIRDRISAKIAKLIGAFGTSPRQPGPIGILYEAVDDYIPRPYSGPVLLMRGRSKTFGFAKDPGLGWGNLLADLTVQEVRGSHFSIMGADSEGLARDITSHVNEVEQRYASPGMRPKQAAQSIRVAGLERA